MITWLLAIFVALFRYQFSDHNHGPFLNETLTSGFLPNSHGDDLFYILLDSRHKPKTDPLVVWLTGGPGCSGEIAIFTENGPFTINHTNEDNLTLLTNPYSWNNQANLLYLDQPAGTGFSNVSTYDSNEDMVAEDFYAFFVNFLDKYPQFKGRDLFLTGESYAGHYIPVIASYMLNQSNNDIKIKGIAMGNGWVDPITQYPAYAKYAYNKSLITLETYQSLANQFDECVLDLSDDDYSVAIIDCMQPYRKIVGSPANFNIYDVRLPCIGPICYNFSFVDNFLAQDEVQVALNVVGKSWTECNSRVHSYFSQDHEMSYASYVVDVLNRGIPVLVYSGVEDFTCNYMGGEAWTNALDYSGHDEFVNASYKPFDEDSEFKQAQNLTFFKVFGAGHLVPMDKPETSLRILQAFMDGYFQKSENIHFFRVVE